MKIVYLVKYTDGFINSLNQKIDFNLPFNQLHDEIIEESSYIFAPFIKEYRKLGHEAELIIPNLAALQRKWCVENDFDFDEDWRMTVPIKQIESIAPDILFMSSNFEYYGEFLIKVKPFTKKVCAWISCPINESIELAQIDHIFTILESYKDNFIAQGVPSTLVHACFDETILNRLPSKKKYDFTFVGGIGGFRKKSHIKRKQHLKYLCRRTPLKIWGYGFASANPIKNFIKQLLTGFVFTKAFQNEAWGYDMLKILAESKITFNSHGEIAKGNSVNVRMFEATGSGALLLTEYTEDIVNFFEPNKEVICYSNIEEAVEKVNYYLANEELRKKIALAGQKRTLENYTYRHLAKKYVTIFEELLSE